VAERVDATDLKSVGRKALLVRVQPGAYHSRAYTRLHGRPLDVLAFRKFANNSTPYGDLISFLTPPMPEGSHPNQKVWVSRKQSFGGPLLCVAQTSR
jgi:hypothetical protein